MEELKQLAKEFCEAEGMNTHTLNTEDMARFSQSLIDKGVLMETPFDHQLLKASYKVLQKQYDELFKLLAILQSKDINVPQLGEVKTLQECKDEISNKIFRGKWSSVFTSLQVTIIDEIAEMYANQFKTTATPVKEISDSEIEKLVEYHTTDMELYNTSSEINRAKNSCKSGIHLCQQWYRDKLKGED